MTTSFEITATRLPRSKIMKKLLWWLPTILAVTLIFTLSDKQIVTLNGKHLDKLMHFLVYAVLASLFTLSLHHSGIKKTLIPALVLTILVGMFDEYFQSFTIVRNSSVYDLMADGLGAVVGTTTMNKIVVLMQKEPQQ